MKPRQTVVIGFLGINLDGGSGPERWERWRPTVSLCQHENLLVSRLDLLFEEKYAPLVESVREDIAGVSPETTVVPQPLMLRDPWDFEEVYGALHDFARSYRFDTDREDYLIHITTGTHVAQICCFLLTESRIFPGKLLQSTPPKGHQRDSAGSFTIIDLDLSKYDRIASRFQSEQRDAVSFLKSGIDTRNREFNRLIERIEQVAIGSREPLLLTGPTGAGKSRLARKIYDLKRARHQVEGDFVEVNCATLRGDAAMSTLFGHVKGAFTSAIQSRPGLLRAADRGVLFLDEIGELGLDEQAMLLRALEDKTFLPMGSDTPVKSDFQLIAGTNRDLGASSGKFRDDLLARINLWTFRLPSLKDRPEDIEPNLDYELEEFARRNGTLATFSREAREAFLAFATSPKAAWSANFRDLAGAVTRMATLATGGRITVALVEEEIARLSESWRGGRGDESPESLPPDIDADRLDLFDRMQLAAVLKVCRRTSSLSEAGRMLFATSRERKSTGNDADRLRKYLMRFGLDPKSVFSKK